MPEMSWEAVRWTSPDPVKEDSKKWQDRTMNKRGSADEGETHFWNPIEPLPSRTDERALKNETQIDTDRRSAKKPRWVLQN